MICNLGVVGSNPTRGSKGKFMGSYQSGQMGQTVNLLAMPSVVRIHHYPLSLISGNSSVVEHFLGKEEVLSSTLSYSSIVLDALGW